MYNKIKIQTIYHDTARMNQIKSGRQIDDLE